MFLGCVRAFSGPPLATAPEPMDTCAQVREELAAASAAKEALAERLAAAERHGRHCCKVGKS